MKITTQAWLRPSARMEDIAAGGETALSALSFFNISDDPDSRKFWQDMGYTFVGMIEATLTLQDMTDEARNTRISVLIKQAEKIRNEARDKANVLEREAFELMPKKESGHA